MDALDLGFAMDLPVVVAGPPAGSQFVLLLGAVVPGLKVSTSSLVFMLKKILISPGTKPYYCFFPVLTSLDYILMLIPFWRTLWLIASHLILLITLGCCNRLPWFVRHSEDVLKNDQTLFPNSASGKDLGQYIFQFYLT